MKKFKIYKNQKKIITKIKSIKRKITIYTLFCSVCVLYLLHFFNNFQLNDYEIRKGKKIGVTISFNNHRLFVGNIPKNRDHDELIEEFAKHARKW